MAFEFLRAENDASPIEKEIVATNGTTYSHGCLVAFGDAGTAVTSTTNAEFVYTGKDTVAETGDKLAVIPVLPEYEFETIFATTATAVKAGMKVQTDGVKVNATTGTNTAIFQLLKDGGASGSKAVGRFA